MRKKGIWIGLAVAAACVCAGVGLWRGVLTDGTRAALLGAISSFTRNDLASVVGAVIVSALAVYEIMRPWIRGITQAVGTLTEGKRGFDDATRSVTAAENQTVRVTEQLTKTVNDWLEAAQKSQRDMEAEFRDALDETRVTVKDRLDAMEKTANATEAEVYAILRALETAIGNSGQLVGSGHAAQAVSAIRKGERAHENSKKASD